MVSSSICFKVTSLCDCTLMNGNFFPLWMLCVFLCADSTDSWYSLSWFLPTFPPILNLCFFFKIELKSKAKTSNVSPWNFPLSLFLVGLGDCPQVYCLHIFELCSHICWYQLIDSPFSQQEWRLCELVWEDRARGYHGWSDKPRNAGWTRRDTEKILCDKNHSEKGLGDRPD